MPLTIAALILGCVIPLVTADDALLQAEQAAFQRAVLSASPSLVTIETIGGFDKLGDVRLNTGATTGTIIGRDGWIMSSAFNLAGEPQAIFVTLDDGRRVSATRVATDEVRQLVLLKANATDLVSITSARPEAAKVGRWAIAVGRTYGATPNISVGVVSALGRIGELAIQTDAKVSPVNYGGPLLDIQGEALGLLVPMSPKTTSGGDALAGIEWYDSGIGFAVPMVDVIESARRLRNGDDLVRGRLGIAFVGTGLLDEPAEVKSVHPLGPADQAGVQPGDVVTALNDSPVDGLRVLKLKLAGLYSGEQVSLSIRRGEETVKTSFELAAELPAYEFAWLGVVADQTETGAVIRSVANDGPSAGKIQAGDIVAKVAGQKTPTPKAAQLAMQGQRPDNEIKIEVVRDGEPLEVTVTPTLLPAEVPDDVAFPKLSDDPVADEERVGRWTGEVLDGAVTFWAYTPPAAASGQRAGLVIWIADGSNALLPVVRAECHARNIALLVPSPAADDWTPGDSAAVEAAVAEVTKELKLDARRIAIVASGSAAPLALTLAQKENSLFAGVVLRDPKLVSPPTAVDPDHRLVWGIIGEEGTKAEAIARFLAKARHPVSLLPDPFESGDTLVRWVDWLGRL